jgi:uncharacterized protein
MYLDDYHSSLKNLCQLNNVKTLYVFGSVLADQFNDKIDIDLVVDIDSYDPFEYTDNYFNFKFALQDLLKRPIDLLENKAIKNPLDELKLKKNDRPYTVCKQFMAN